MLFRNVAGCHELKGNLLQIASENCVPHAMIFTGRPGTGKLGMALAFARYLNCEAPGADDACNECRSCRKYAKLEHPDLHLVFPVAKLKNGEKDPVSDTYISRWREAVLENHYLSLYMWMEKLGVENSQGFISIRESQQIMKKLSLKSFEARYKVMIIWMAEKMNPAASGKLLKILEEPPAGTLFMMVAEDTGRILPTILSRTQIFRVPPIDKGSMQRLIGEKGINDPDKAGRLAKLSEGSYLKLQELLEEGDENSYNFSMFVKFMRLCFIPDFAGIMQWTEEMGARGRERQKHFLETALRLIRGNLIMNVKAGDIDLLPDEEKEWSVKFSKFIHPGNVHTLYDEFGKASLHIEHNGYSRLVLFDLAIKTARLLKT